MAIGLESPTLVILCRLPPNSSCEGAGFEVIRPAEFYLRRCGPVVMEQNDRGGDLAESLIKLQRL